MMAMTTSSSIKVKPCAWQHSDSVLNTKKHSGKPDPASLGGNGHVVDEPAGLWAVVLSTVA